MNTISTASSRTAAVAFAFVLLPLAVAAQNTPAAGQIGQGPMIVERVPSGFAVTPEVKVTRFDGRTSELVGADAGWLADQMFFIGGGGYWLASQSHDRQLAYGGLVMGLFTPVDRPVSFGVKTLLGGGRAAVLRPVTILSGPYPYPDDIRIQTPGVAPNPIVPQFITTNARFREDIFVLEPEANVVFRIGRRLRVTAGAGYRWIGRERGGLDGLGGATGSVGLQIGGG